MRGYKLRSALLPYHGEVEENPVAKLGFVSADADCAEFQAGLQNQAPPERFVCDALQTAEAMNVALSLTTAVQQMISALMAQGRGELGRATIATVGEGLRALKQSGPEPNSETPQ